ncbi:hypothetical protein BpHYR1_047526 [Brachionus plicatilis]|uniref:Uncharacterized protein n=1 Tax=Brachionus plicatilis TaxID=10195 RepID=A0A3M7T6G9_BRAPC|nr:hypothetical protein BpHYR1_047526 [Brachionus plicatilis]
MNKKYICKNIIACREKGLEWHSNSKDAKIEKKEYTVSFVVSTGGNSAIPDQIEVQNVSSESDLDEQENLVPIVNTLKKRGRPWFKI